jgi:hypothetical protein
MVDDIYLDFEKHFHQFDSYRSKINNEENIFEKELYDKCSIVILILQAYLLKETYGHG